MRVAKMLSHAGVAAAFALLQTAAYGQTKQMMFGTTSVSLSFAAVDALGSLGVAIGALGPGQLNGTTASFPITAGELDLTTAKGEIFHSGGLSFTAGGTVVQLFNFTIDTTSSPILTGAVAVNGTLLGRLPLFDLQLAGLSLPIQPASGYGLTLTNVGVTLDAAAAGALNKVFNVNAFVPGLTIGTATVKTAVLGPFTN
jgi:hypothetical protein